MKLGGILNFECWGLGNEEPKEVTERRRVSRRQNAEAVSQDLTWSPDQINKLKWRLPYPSLKRSAFRC